MTTFMTIHEFKKERWLNNLLPTKPCCNFTALQNQFDKYFMEETVPLEALDERLTHPDRFVFRKE